MTRTLLLAAPALLIFANFTQAQVVTPLAQAQYNVDTWYRQFLGRQPDPSAAVWVLALVNGKPAGDVLSDILASREFFTLAGGTNAGFIALLYQDQLGRTPTNLELFFWVDLLRTQSRKAVALLFLTSQGNVAVAITQVQNVRRHHRR